MLQPLFRLSIVAFLIGGVVIVLGQALGIILGNAQWVEHVEASAQPATCIAASICGILSFALSYGRPAETIDATVADPLPQQAPAASRS
ncbi:hypothetical protein OG379_35255 [Streptomyces sp. NBC_01166]|uniref:hypothetical protein n=1 Tax=Streptomyces sp. NBC_01166 TaxID=2903755 RepID=UPI00386DD68D|nr:hypothetical protein OG379_35255 [Streptomyces sp. NBC_01166]